MLQNIKFNIMGNDVKDYARGSYKCRRRAFKVKGFTGFSLVFYLMSSLYIKYSKGALQKIEQF